MHFFLLYITEMLNRNIGIVGVALTEYPVCGDKLQTKLKNSCSNIQ